MRMVEKLKLNRLQRLFAELQIILAEEIYKQYDKVTNKVAEEQKADKQAILNSIAKIILEVEIVDGVLKLSATSKIRFKKQLNKFDTF